MLAHLVRRVRMARGIDDVVVATSDQIADEAIRRFCVEAGINCYAGDEQDVLDRFYQAAVAFGGNPVIRITADCPLADPEVLSELVSFYHSSTYDHVGVATGAGAIFMSGGRYPDGYDAECMSLQALEHAWREARADSDREHVTPFIWRQPDVFRLGTLESPVDYSRLRLTVDNEEDFRLIETLYDELHQKDKPFLLRDVVDFLKAHPELVELNQAHVGHEGYAELWQPDAA